MSLFKYFGCCTFSGLLLFLRLISGHLRITDWVSLLCIPSECFTFQWRYVSVGISWINISTVVLQCNCCFLVRSTSPFLNTSHNKSSAKRLLKSRITKRSYLLNSKSLSIIRSTANIIYTKTAISETSLFFC